RRAPGVGGAFLAMVVAGDLCFQGRGIGTITESPGIAELRHTNPTHVEAIKRDHSVYRVKSRYANPAELMLAMLPADSGPGRHVLDYQRYDLQILSHDSPL